MAELRDLHLNYIEDNLVPEIVSKLEDETLVSSETEPSSGLDGFMSALYNIKLKTKTAKGDTKQRILIAKFMKGDVAFRESSKAYTQFANEIFVYAKVLPAFDQVLKAANVTDVKVADWVAPSYVAKFGYIEGLSQTPTERESVLVLENLKPQGYRLGPRLYLNRDHLLSMTKSLGEYHAISIALRERDPEQLQRLKSEIVPLPFIYTADSPAEKQNLYRVLYRVAFDRFFAFFDRRLLDSIFDFRLHSDRKLIMELRQMRDTYFDEPTLLLERLRTQIERSDEDRHWGVILHGDFNRNNVLFAYKEDPVSSSSGESEEKPFGETRPVRDVKMIDFQELRYGSPAIDLSFFMYFNTPENLRATVWMETLKKYHTHLFSTLSSIMKAGKTDPKELEEIDNELKKKYCYSKFVAHFNRYAMYGVMICLHFLPWILCSEEECARLAHLFETDMHGEEFHKLSVEAGGDKVNMCLLKIFRHASQMDYMEQLFAKEIL